MPARCLVALAGLMALALAPAAPARAQLGRSLDDPRPGAPAAERAPRPDTDVAVPPPSGAGYAVAPSTAPLESATATRLRALESSFQLLGARGPDYASTVLSMVGGGIQIGLAALMLEFGDEFVQRLAPYYFVSGGIGVVRPAVVDFFLRPDARSAAIEFQHMPMGTEEERQARLRFGERELESLAERSFIARVVDASFNIVSALAVIPAYLVPRLEETSMDFQWFEAFVFLGPAIGLVGAIIGLASRTPEEQRWEAYQQLRRRLAVELD